MSNSDDDDWDKKDIDEMVQQIYKNKLINSESASNATNEQLTNPGTCLPTYESAGTHKDENRKNKRQQQKKEEIVQGISFKKLCFISKQSPMNTFLEVTQNDCGFFKCLNESLPNEYIALSLKIFSKLCELPLDEFKNDFLSYFIQPKYLNQISKFISEIISEMAVRNKELLSINISEITSDLIKILKNVVSFSLYENIEKFLENSLNRLENAVNNFHDLKKMFTELKQKIEIDKRKNQIKDIYPTLEELKTSKLDELKPNIREDLHSQVSLPTLEELNTSKLDELKPNLREGKYDSIEQYQEIHMNLLREAITSPLYSKISKIISYSNLDRIQKTMGLQKVRFVLNDVHRGAYTRYGETLLLDLKPHQRGLPDEQSAKYATKVESNKLLLGSLLCLTTSPNFDDLILATASNTDIDTISKGYVQVEILKLYNIAEIVKIDFIMIKSQNNFEPYHYVHRVLKNLDETNFPMQNFIIDLDSEHHMPDYLKQRINVKYQHKKHFFNPLNLKSYPSNKVLQLDESQLEAYYYALSHKFSLIQGLPGTGKTYTGLEIAATLIENLKEQILIICHSNHGLDQFLSEITNLTKNIVRMGHNSKHKLLDKYNIKQMNDPAKLDQRFKSCLHNTKIEYLELMKEFKRLQRTYYKSEESDKIIVNVQEKLRKKSRKVDELNQLRNYNFIKDKRVIGMTTACAVRCHSLLQLLKTPIVLIEDASELLESHIIASLTKSTQHVILIGGHQESGQTSMINNLSHTYKMDTSLFERMANTGYSICLSTQHEIQPEDRNRS